MRTEDGRGGGEKEEGTGERIGERGTAWDGRKGLGMVDEAMGMVDEGRGNDG